MEIRARLPLPAEPSLQPPAGPAPLKLGDVVAAVVRARLSETSFLLQIAPGGKTLVAQSATDLPPGTNLKLEVTKLGVTPELRPVPLETPTTAMQTGTAAETADAAEERALRQFLPKQIALAEFTADLATLAGKASSLPAPARQAIASLLAALPPRSQLATPEGLARAIRDSGIFFEARLAAAAGLVAAFPDGDVKGHLLALLNQLRPPRPEAPFTPGTKTADQPSTRSEPKSASGADFPKLDALAQQVEGALARVSLDQLASLPRQDGAQTWQLEIPFADSGRGDTAKLRITAEEKHTRGGETSQSWSVNLELRPPGLGSFCARVVLLDGSIDTYLWSDTADTAESISKHRELLRARLEQAGLAVGRLEALEQAPAPIRTERIAPSLLDIRA